MIVYRVGSYSNPDELGQSWVKVPGIIGEHLAVGDGIVWVLGRLNKDSEKALFVRTGKVSAKRWRCFRPMIDCTSNVIP